MRHMVQEGHIREWLERLLGRTGACCFTLAGRPQEVGGGGEASAAWTRYAISQSTKVKSARWQFICFAALKTSDGAWQQSFYVLDMKSFSVTPNRPSNYYLARCVLKKSNWQLSMTVRGLFQFSNVFGNKSRLILSGSEKELPLNPGISPFSLFSVPRRFQYSL